MLATFLSIPRPAIDSTENSCANMTRKIITGIILFGCTASVFAEGSPWLPSAGSNSLGLTYTTQSTDEFFIASERTSIFGDLEGEFVWLNYGLGITDQLALDVRTSYARTSFETNPLEQSGTGDSAIGLTWQWRNEFEADDGTPTIATRLGYTIGGDYETALIDAIGDGASGLDLSLLVGKVLGEKFAVQGDLSYKTRDDDVPDSLLYSISGFYIATPSLNLSLGYNVIDSQGDIDIGSPEFISGGVSQFNRTRKDSEAVIVGLNYSFEPGISLGLSYSNLIDGRNVADADVASLSIGYSF